MPQSAKRSNSSRKRLPYPHPTSAGVTAAMKGNRRVDTRPEVALRAELHRRGLRFRKEMGLRPLARLRRVDIAFPAAKIVVFVDGCFWHGCPVHGNKPRVNTDYWSPKLERNRERDQLVDAEFASAGWCVIRIWEHEGVVEAADRIEARYSSVRARHA